MKLLLTFLAQRGKRMKNMRSFSLVVLSTMLLLSSVPVVAMDGPEFDFTGANEAATELYGKVSTKAKEGFEAAKVIYNENAPKVVSVVKGLAQDAKTAFANAQNGMANANQAEVEVSVAAPAVIVPVVAAPIVVAPKAKAGFSVKNVFSQMAESVKNNGFKVKEAVKAHPVITGAVIAAIVAVPVAFFAYKKVQQNRKNAAIVKTVVVNA